MRKPYISQRTKPLVATDAQVLELRRLHEVERMPMIAVAKAHPQYSVGWVYDVLQYRFRAKAGRPVKGEA